MVDSTWRKLRREGKGIKAVKKEKIPLSKRGQRARRDVVPFADITALSELEDPGQGGTKEGCLVNLRVIKSCRPLLLCRTSFGSGLIMLPMTSGILSRRGQDDDSWQRDDVLCAPLNPRNSEPF